MPAISLTDLQEQIAQREQELQALREELQNRQNHLVELNRRKEKLQNELRQIEAEIAALAATEARPTKQPTPTTPKVPPSPASAARAEDQPQLGDLITTMLRETSTAMTGRQLLEEAQRRGYQSKSHDPLKAMENHLQVLKSRGVVRRAKGQYGFILASSANGAKNQKSKTSQPAKTESEKTPAKPEPTARNRSGKGASSTEAAKPTKPGRRGGQTPLRVVLTNLLKRSHKPLSGSELAERALKAGYTTKSKTFVDSVWSMLGQMDNVEHLPQQGYRLKKQ